jgi:hypothetical protein
MLPLFYYIEFFFLLILYILIVQCHSCCPQGFRSVEGLLLDLNLGLPYSKLTRYCLNQAAPLKSAFFSVI